MENNTAVLRDIQTITVCSPNHAHPLQGALSPPAYSNSQHPAGQPQQRKGISLWWGIWGSSILSVVGFVALALFEQYNESINELQRDLKRFNENCADLVKKDALRHRMVAVWDRIKELQAANLVHKGQENRCALIDLQVKSLETERRELAKEVQLLRERLAAIEGRRSNALRHNRPAGVTE